MYQLTGFEINKFCSDFQQAQDEVVTGLKATAVQRLANSKFLTMNTRSRSLVNEELIKLQVKIERNYPDSRYKSIIKTYLRKAALLFENELANLLSISGVKTQNLKKTAEKNNELKLT